MKCLLKDPHKRACLVAVLTIGAVTLLRISTATAGDSSRKFLSPVYEVEEGCGLSSPWRLDEDHAK